jgi:multidrug resistance efflux pump
MKPIRQLLANLKNPRILQPLLAVVIIIFIVGGVYFYETRRNRLFIENSLITAPISSISPLNPGKLMEMDVYEGETVKQGDVLAVVGTDTLRADTDGIVVMANNQIGGLMSAATPVVQLINPNYLRVDGTVDENKGLNQIAIGQVVSFTVDALPGETFWGYVDEIAPTAKQTQLSFSISSSRPTQQFDVYARFSATDYPQIKNGMSAKMTIFTK